jgi:hypothetical protein
VRLKLVVIGMGVVILVGFVVVVVTLVDRLANPREPQTLGEVRLEVPAGCQLADAWSDAERLYLRYAGEGCGLVVVVEAESGRELARYGGGAQPQ